MGMEEAVRTVLGKYADFNGRARRSEYWYWTLAVLIVDIVVQIIDAVLGTGILSIVLGLALLVPGIAVATRRLHDTGRSGWWQLLWFAILVGWIVLIVWYATDSKPGPNKYGPNPKGMDDAYATGYGAPPVA